MWRPRCGTEASPSRETAAAIQVLLASFGTVRYESCASVDGGIVKRLLPAVMIMSISSVVGPAAEQLNPPAVETELRKLNYEVAQMQVRKDVAAAKRPDFEQGAKH
jgi:hypothetical protein